VKDLSIKKGDLYFADLSPVMGSEQGGVRPVLVVQNDIGNKYSPTIIVAAITSKHNKANLPTHVKLAAQGNGLNRNSVILLEQLRTIDKSRLKERIGTIDKTHLPEVNEALSISLGIEGNRFF
jgi:mRNA interferase MazF